MLWILKNSAVTSTAAFTAISVAGDVAATRTNTTTTTTTTTATTITTTSANNITT